MELKKAGLEHNWILLYWRNSVEARENSHSMEFIGKDEHEAWLHATLRDHNKQLFIAIEDGVMVGAVRADFDPATESFTLSWMTAPAERGKGYGKAMVKLLVARLKGTLHAEIKKGNVASIKIAEYVGMKMDKEVEGFLHYYKNTEVDDKMKIIDAIEKVRQGNNVNWMDLLRVALRSNPEQTKAIIRKINTDDGRISELFKQLGE
jgi:RimJ/RimL family protein N-acetyltransferase